VPDYYERAIQLFSQIGVIVSEQDKLVRRVCRFCGNTFWAKRKDARYCKPEHRQAYKRWRGKLSASRIKGEMLLSTIADYMLYEDSKTLAAHTLLDLRRYINSRLDAHGIKDVK
jgi:hypothetical protein